MVKSPEKKREARKLRETGLSLRDIVKKLNTPFSTIRAWVKDIQLSEEQLRVLKHRNSIHLLNGRVPGTKTKRRKMMGEENWEIYQKERQKKKRLNYKHTYNAKWWSDKRKKLKQALVDYKGGRCIKCGYNKYLAALEFHHRDPSKKDFIIAKAYSINFDRVKKEVDKCDLLCCRCHVETHEELKTKVQ